MRYAATLAGQKMIYSQHQLTKTALSGHDAILEHKTGTYTTFRTFNRDSIPEFDMHIKRLVNDRFTYEDVRQQIIEAFNSLIPQFEGEIRVYCFSNNDQLDFFAEKLPSAPQSANFGCCQERRDTPNIKTTAWATKRQGLEKIKNERHFNEIFIHDEHCKEGLSSNLFIVKNGVVQTAPAEFVLSGTVRSMVFDICRELSIPCVEQLFTVHDMQQADCVFATSTSRGILPGNAVWYQQEDKTVNYTGNNEVVAKLRAGYDRMLSLKAVKVA